MVIMFEFVNESPQSVHWQIEQFLYKEARLIDDRKLDDWLDLWTMDCRYHVPVRQNLTPPIGEGLLPIEDELSDDDGVAWIDDDKIMLFARVMRLRTGKAWSESPLARTRRMVSNVEVEVAEDIEGYDAAYKVTSNLLQFRSRRQTEENLFVCQRQDLIVCSVETLQIKHRKVVLDGAVLNSSYVTLI
jgi:3-phenylpropionate/cinnamic acid dioxygenase small subunit